VRLSELLDSVLVDTTGKPLGKIRDVELVQDGPVHGTGQAAFRVVGLVAGRTAIGTRLGYTTFKGLDTGRETRAPLLVRAAVRFLQRKAVYVSWDDVQAIEDGRVVIGSTR
jgi:sporulation protein YlmC with PRC-barrel domain